MEQITSSLQLLEKWMRAEEKLCDIENQVLFIRVGYRVDMTPQILETQYLAQPESAEVVAIQFQMELMALASPSFLQEVTSFLFFLNRMAEPPGFFLHELDDTIYYRYVWFGKEMERETFCVLVSKFSHLYETYSGLIQDICQGKLTFHQAIAQIQ